MSSVSRGDAFEDRVFDAIKKELDGNRLGLSPNTARPFKKRGYFSRDRNSNIIVDISIEVWPPGAANWSFLCVFECKDYAGTIPVGDVEEFKGKLDQITAANRKGFIAMSGTLQPSALAYARSNGIGVIRVLPSDQVQYILHMETGKPRLGVDPREFDRALTQPGFIGYNRALYAVDGRDTFGEWGPLLKNSLTHLTDSF